MATSYPLQPSVVQGPAKIVFPLVPESMLVLPASYYLSMPLVTTDIVGQIAQTIVAVKQALVSNMPVILDMLIYDSFASPLATNTGIIPLPQPTEEKELGRHMVTIVGYNDTDNAVLALNNWGNTWGCSHPNYSDVRGFCWIPYILLTNPQFATIHAVLATPHVPKAVLEPVPEPVVVAPELEPVVVAPEPVPEPEPVIVAPEPMPDPVHEPVIVAPEPVPEPVIVAPEPVPEPVIVAPEPVPEPVIVAPEPVPEPVIVAPEHVPEPVIVAPEPLPEPVIVMPEPIPEPVIVRAPKPTPVPQSTPAPAKPKSKPKPKPKQLPTSPIHRPHPKPSRQRRH